jgi:dihydropteroate synthase
MLSPQTTLNCNGTLLDVISPIVMGILNVTPDSFFDGGQYQNEKKMLTQVEKMLTQGAEIIDIGGMSSRPGAAFVSSEEEIKRVLPTIQSIKKHFPEAILSVDTWRSLVAKASVEHGAGIINDISGGQFDETLFETVASFKNIPFILMHIQGTPDSMQIAPHYDNVLEDILKYFIEKTGKLRELGVKDIVLDPGFGFGKTIAHNYEILKNMHVFQIMDLIILAGISRKSMIYKYLDIEPSEALSATSALHLVALQQGARILRAHDVKEAKEVIALHQLLQQS